LANEHLEEPNPQIVVEEILVPSSSTSTQVETELNMHTDVAEVRQSEEQVLRRSHRTVCAPERYMGLHEVSVFDAEDPLTYAEAEDRPDSDKWPEAMRSEIQSIYDNTVWNQVAPPAGVKSIANKWIFKRKIDMDGNMSVYKARLVEKDFKQILIIDYDETFSSVTMFKSIRMLLAIVAFYDYKIWQMNVKTAFLNENLEDDVYMILPTYFEHPKNAGKVCKLLRSIYELKQVSWIGIFDLTKKSKSLASSNAKKNLMYTEKLVGVSSIF
jgi:Reverse transcriptase (RNA-dependent DNA polymerase)